MAPSPAGLLAAADEGDGFPVVLLPGAAADRQLFVQAGTFRLLAARYRVVAVDWRGAGESEAPPPDYDIAAEVADVIRLLDHKQITQAFIVGVSHGAAVALSLAAAHPDRVKALVLCSPWARTEKSMRQMLNIWRTLFEHEEPQVYGEGMLWWLFSPEFLDAEPARVAAMASAMFVAPSSATRNTHLKTLEMNLSFDVKDRLKSIWQPALVMAAERDRVVPASYSRRVADQLPNCRFHLVTGPGCSHAFLAEAGPGPNQTLAAFLDELSLQESAQPLDVFDRWYRAHESGDVDGLGAVLSQDVTIHSLFKPEPVRGRDAALAHFVGVNNTFSNMAITITESPTAAHDRVLAEADFSGAFTGKLTWEGVSHSGTGQRFRVSGVVLVRITDGRVISVRTLFDRDDLLRQIGVIQLRVATRAGSAALEGAPG